MIKEIIKWRPLIIGIILVVALYIVSDVISGQNILLPAFILGGIAVGFMVGGEIKKSAINGVFLGLIGGIIVSVILMIMMYYQGYGEYMGSMITTIVLYIVLEIVLGTIGGVFGSLIEAESLKD